MRRLAAALVLLLTAAGLGACDTSNYAFKIDESIDIVTPEARKEVPLPVQLRWTDSKKPPVLRVAPKEPNAEYYAVFMDRAAIAPGRRLSSLIDDTQQCDPADGCPTLAQLTDLRVYLVSKTSLDIDFVADLRPSSRGDSKDVHEVTIVRMRGDRRVGEAAFLQTFFVRR